MKNVPKGLLLVSFTKIVPREYCKRKLILTCSFKASQWDVNLPLEFKATTSPLIFRWNIRV